MLVKGATGGISTPSHQLAVVIDMWSHLAGFNLFWQMCHGRMVSTLAAGMVVEKCLWYWEFLDTNQAHLMMLIADTYPAASAQTCSHASFIQYIYHFCTTRNETHGVFSQYSILSYTRLLKIHTTISKCTGSGYCTDPCMYTENPREPSHSSHFCVISKQQRSGEPNRSY